jgi:23S rRNA (uracil1939-C5)-methyltransferase
MERQRNKNTRKKNDLISLTITGMTSEGSGVGRHDGIVIFVANTAVGDQITARIIKVSKSYCIGKIETLDVPSPDRIPVDCPVFSQCGGCVYRHLSYESELQIKEQRVADVLHHIGGLESLPLHPIVGAEQTDRYRNKAQLPIGKDRDGRIIFGFYASRSHRIIRCDDCALQPVEFQGAMKAVTQWWEETGETIYDETTHRGKLRHLYLREGSATLERMVCLVINGSSVAKEERLVSLLRTHVPGLKSVVLNENREDTNVILGKRFRTLWGSDTITDTLCGLQFRIAPPSFYQVNRDQAERLYTIAGEYAGLTGQETLLDLYCGTGTIGLTMAHKAKRLIGVEIIPEAIENAKENAKENGISNAEFLCGDASVAAATLEKRGLSPDVIILDPPRKGCDPQLIATVVRMNPERIVYVSCDPATLSRDVKQLGQCGYTVTDGTPVDLFPRTSHVETVVLLTKANP